MYSEDRKGDHMKVLLYFENQNMIRKSGIGRALKHQIIALQSQGIEYTLDPRESFDIAHINTVGLQSQWLIHRCHQMHKKVIVHAHSTEEDFKNSFILSNQMSSLFRKRLMTIYSKADCLITPTAYSKKLISHYVNKDIPIYAISNGVDIEEYNDNEERIQLFKQYFHLTSQQKVIICVGLFFQRKGILDFIEIAQKLPQYTFIWFGDISLYTIPQQIRNVIKHHPSNVIFPGYITGDIIKGAYCGADAFFFPSYEETEGIVVLEALSSYQQVILRDIPVYEGWLIHGKNCYKGKDNDEFIELIQNVVEKKLPYLGKEGRKVAEERSLERVGKQLKTVYHSLL